MNYFHRIKYFSLVTVFFNFNNMYKEKNEQALG